MRGMQQEKPKICATRFAFVALALVLLVLFVAGCATNTVETRKRERPAAYDALTPEMKTLVDMGQIKVGMPMDAVYIAWGKPTQVSTGQSPDGKNITTWIYSGTAWQEYRYWSYRHYYYGRHGAGYAAPTIDYDYIPYSYTAAEVTFQDGVVKSWRNLSPPAPY